MNTHQLTQRPSTQLRPTHNTRVPRITNLPDRFHTLLLKLGQCSKIESFAAKMENESLVLKITLRPGEIANLVVIQTVKQLFKSFTVKFPANFEQQPLEIIVR